WLFSDRAATARSAEDDLEEMVKRLKDSSWSEAHAARDRAKGRLGDGGPTRLRRLVDQGTHDLELAARLDAIRLTGSETVGGVGLLTKSDEAYADAFRMAGLGSVDEDAEVVAGRIKDSNIRNALIAALDHWSVCTTDSRRRAWILEVARKADEDPTGWR